MRKATNRTSYKEVCALYEATGRTDYRLQTVNDIKVIHGFDILETTGYEDLTEEQNLRRLCPETLEQCRHEHKNYNVSVFRPLCTGNQSFKRRNMV